MDLVRYINLSPIDLFAICPPFRPTLSAIWTPSYKSAKFLVPKLSSITFNEFTVKDEEMVHQDGKIFVGSLDVDSHSSPIHILNRSPIFVPICYITK